MQDFNDEDTSDTSSEITDEDIIEMLDVVLLELFDEKIFFDDIPNKDALFIYCKPQIIAYFNDSTSSNRLKIFNNVCFFLIGKPCAYNDTIFKALDLYAEYINKLKYLYVYQHIGELPLNRDVIGYMRQQI